MATQTDVQQLIQGLTPSGVNNGNPNTAYNFAPPTQDAQGNWFGGGVGPAASITALNLTPRTPWTPPENTGVPGGNLLDLLPSIPEGGIPMAPGWSPTPQPSPAPQPGGPTTGGGKGPQGQGWNDGPATGIGGGGGGGGGTPPKNGGLGPGSNPPGTISGVDVRSWANSFGLPFDNNTGTLDTSRIAKNPSEFMGKIGNLLGHTIDLFIPGDAFDSRTGFDASNVVTTILNNMIPVLGPLSSLIGHNLLDKVIESISDNLPDWVPDWAKNLIKDHVEDQRKQREKKDKNTSSQSGTTGGGGINYGSFDQSGRTNDGLGLGGMFGTGGSINTGTVSVGDLIRTDSINTGNPAQGGTWGFMPSGGGGGGGGAGGGGSGGGGGISIGGGSGGGSGGGARQAYWDRYYSRSQ